jgi:single-strand DNA-binding protein
MSNDINNVVLVGRLTKDAELRFTNSGTAVINFSIAVNEAVKQSDGSWGDSPNFFDVQYWGKQAESINQYLTKGRQISLQGKLKHQTWQDQQTGQNRSKVLINAFIIQLLANPNGNQQNPQAQTQNYSQGYPSPMPSAPQQQRFDGFNQGRNPFDPPSGPQGFPGPEQFQDDIPF